MQGPFFCLNRLHLLVNTHWAKPGEWNAYQGMISPSQIPTRTESEPLETHFRGDPAWSTASPSWEHRSASTLCLNRQPRSPAWGFLTYLGSLISLEKEQILHFPTHQGNTNKQTNERTYKNRHPLLLTNPGHLASDKNHCSSLSLSQDFS